MDHFYVACDFGSESGRVMLATLRKDHLHLSEISRFPNQPLTVKDSIHWDIPELYRHTLEALRKISSYEEPVNSISCTAWADDHLLFAPDGSLLSPVSRCSHTRGIAAMKSLFAKISRESLYDETGIHLTPLSTLCQIATETPRRLRHTSQIMPIADGFNFLLSGVPRVERSSASSTHLYNPITENWSARITTALRLPTKLLPPIVAAGTRLGTLRPDIARETGLNPAHVIASCSHEIAAALAGLPPANGEHSVFLKTGPIAIIGTELHGPIINDDARDLGFSNEFNSGGMVRFSKPLPGTAILDDCRRYWKETERDLEADVLYHLAISAEPFESFINPTDPRFQTPENMPLKIQAFCEETGQPVPRKPGPIIRCVLESLALWYRRALWEIEHLTGRDITKLYVLGGSKNDLLLHFTANALQIPVVILPPEATAIGNVVIQALVLGHLESIDHARAIVRNSFRFPTITPQATVWNPAYDQFARLCAAA